MWCGFEFSYVFVCVRVWIYIGVGHNNSLRKIDESTRICIQFDDKDDCNDDDDDDDITH